MKKLLLLLFALLSVTMLQAGQSIVINGKITNCSNRDNVSLRKFWFNASALEELSSYTNFKIDEDGSFHVEIPDANEFYAKYWIHLGNEGTLLELIAGDSLTMTVNADIFNESIRHIGRGAGRNNYRRDIFLQFWQSDEAGKVVNTADPNEFLRRLSNLRDRKLELLNKYFLAQEIDSNYYHYEKALIINEIANLVLINNNTYHYHKFLPGKIISQMESFVNAADISDERILNNKESRELIAGLPGYLQEISPLHQGADLNREINWAKVHYTPLMRQFAYKEIMRKYLTQAPGISQRRALLNYFDKQEIVPAIKDEIQQLRNSLKNDRAINSRLFQAAVIIIFWLLMIVVILFALIKLIQYLGKSHIKVNISLWLKIIFYLGAGILSLAYMGNVNAPLSGFPFVILMFGVFLLHTYVLIPRYALQRNPRYYLLIAIAFFVFAAGNIITNQIPNSLVQFLILTELYSLVQFLILTELFFALVLLSWISYYIHQMASGKSTLKELRKKNDLNPEIAFNLLATFLANFIFIASISPYGNLNEVVLFYTILFLFYFHTFFTYTRYFCKDKVLQFIGINILVILIATILMIAQDAIQSFYSLKNIGLSIPLSDLLSINNIRPDWLLIFCLLLIPSFVYYFIKKRLSSMDSAGFRLYRKKEAELAQLKSQVNPHFLFNTLNTLYAFALKEGSDKTAECIAKLANLMRFMLDDMEKESIPLTREISYIKDYIKLQSIRSAVEHDITINVEMEEEKSYSIAPMLLIPFVENAFKHGMNPGKVSQLKIDIRAKGHQIQFVIDNSIDDNFQAYYKEKGFGIGIENVKSRLMHVYPDRHTISIAKTTTNFIVILTINLE